MYQPRSPVVKPSPEEIMPIFKELLPRVKIKTWVDAAKVRMYWRLFTPLIIVWGFILQRLQTDHTCDAVVSHFHTGAIDNLDPAETHLEPFSQRLQSESTSAYVQGRNRLPLRVLVSALQTVTTIIQSWLPKQPDAPTGWKGYAVRLLDGTTFRLRPRGDLPTLYSQAANQHGPSEWVVVRSVAAFCLYSQSVVAYHEGPTSTSEMGLVKPIMRTDPVKASLYLADQGLGVYRTAQIARAYDKKVILRVEHRTAHALEKRNGFKRPLKPGETSPVAWTPSPVNKVEPGLDTSPIDGRLICARLVRPGFRPIDLYLFTTLLDDSLSPAAEIVELYGQRLRAEISYRHLKTSLEMDEFDVHSVAMFRKELAAGLLTYNLICGFMVKAALLAQLRPSQLSFKRCWRRIRAALLTGIPAWVDQAEAVYPYLLKRLAQCKLPHQPNKVQYEPRKVRRRPAVYPSLKGDRQTARQEVLNQLLAVPIS